MESTTKKQRRSPLIMKVVKPTPLTEKQLQEQIVNYLRWQRYEVLEVGKGRKGVTCPTCHSFHVPSGWQGNTPGCPDLFVSHPRWKEGTWIGVELKTEKGAIREEQQRLLDASRVYIARSLDDVIRILKEGNWDDNRS